MEFYYHEVNKNVLILAVDGGLNASTAEQFVGEIERVIDAGITRIVVDCSSLDYISSYGVSLLLRLHKKMAHHGGDVKLACIKSPVIKILALLRLDRILSIYPDVNEARLAFRT
jgi:anti-sigma B factor antagonist